MKSAGSDFILNQSYLLMMLLNFDWEDSATTELWHEWLDFCLQFLLGFDLITVELTSSQYLLQENFTA
jgi:hypothetical protein